MPSYMDLQAELVEQKRVYDEYLSDLRLKAQKFFADFKTYLDVPDEALLGRDGEHLPYVDFGKVEGETFTRCNRNELVLVGSTVNFSIVLNFVQNGLRTGLFLKIAISKKDLFYTVTIEGQPASFQVNGVNGNPDFTEVFEALSRQIQERLRQRP